MADARPGRPDLSPPCGPARLAFPGGSAETVVSPCSSLRRHSWRDVGILARRGVANVAAKTSAGGEVALRNAKALLPTSGSGLYAIAKWQVVAACLG